MRALRLDFSTGEKAILKDPFDYALYDEVPYHQTSGRNPRPQENRSSWYC